MLQIFHCLENIFKISFSRNCSIMVVNLYIINFDFKIFCNFLGLLKNHQSLMKSHKDLDCDKLSILTLT